MASYIIQSARSGDQITVPDSASLTVNDLLIIGDGKTDWNEPYNKNFIKLDDKIFALETAVNSMPTSQSISYIDTLQTVLDSKAAISYVDSEIVNTKAYADQVAISSITSAKTYTDLQVQTLTEQGGYILPAASSTVLGGVKAGTNITIDANGVISANDTSVAWPEITAKPTTLSGYGITDAYTKTEVESKIIELAPIVDISSKADIAYVDNKFTEVIGLAPATLNTFGEIAVQLTTDEGAVAALTIVVDGKVDKVTGKGLSTEDYTTAEKEELASLAIFKQDCGTITEFNTALDANK